MPKSTFKAFSVVLAQKKKKKAVSLEHAFIARVIFCYNLETKLHFLFGSTNFVTNEIFNKVISMSTMHDLQVEDYLQLKTKIHGEIIIAEIHRMMRWRVQLKKKCNRIPTLSQKYCDYKNKTDIKSILGKCYITVPSNIYYSYTLQKDRSSFFFLKQGLS